MIVFTFFDTKIDMHLEGSTTELEVVDNITGYRVGFRPGHIRIWDADGVKVIDTLEESL